MEELYLEREAGGGIATIVINRPKQRNAFTVEMWIELHRLLAELKTDPELRVLIIRGEGDLAFSAGADIGQFERWRSTKEKARLYRSLTGAARDSVAAFPVPVIAQIAG